MIKAYKYRLRPTKHQIDFFEKSFGCSRYVYNWALNLRVESYQKDKTRLSWLDICKELTTLKKTEDHTWLNEVPNQSLQYAIKNMDAAFTRFFREKKGFPKFKSKKCSKKSFQYAHRVEVDFENNRMKLPNLGWVKFFNSRTFTGEIGTVTISKSATGKYYASVLVDTGEQLPVKPVIKASTAVGIDVGLKDFAVLSNGQVYENPRYLERAEARLKVLQRRFSKSVKGSNRRERKRLLLARQYEKVTNARTNFIHQVTSRIIRENQTIIIEDLNVEGMLKNHCLAKQIQSASWHEFFRQLTYKSEWYGRNLIKIGRFEPSSKMCLCGHINKELKLSQRVWSCPSCGRRNDRDLLAAINIKRFGLQEQNLIGYSPVGNGVEDVEWSAVADTVKRQYVHVT